MTLSTIYQPPIPEDDITDPVDYDGSQDAALGPLIAVTVVLTLAAGVVVGIFIGLQF